MPLLDHFHPPLHGPRRWEGFHHAWATGIAQQLNQDVLPPDYFAEPEISVGSQPDVNVASFELWTPPRSKLSFSVDFAHLENYEIRVYQGRDGPELRGAIVLVTPANKKGEASRRM